MTGALQRRGRRFGALIALAISLSAPSAAAQTGASVLQVRPTAELEEDAKRAFEEGQKAADAKQWDKARDAFARAYATAPQPRRALALARVELTLNKHRDAAEHFAHVLREAKDLSATEKKEIEASLAKCVAKVGSLVVKVAPAGAEVFIDDVLAGTSPLAGPVYVEPGSHRVEAKLEGKQPVSERVGLVAGASLDVEMTLSGIAGESLIKVKVRNESGDNAMDHGVKPKPVVSTRNKKVIYAGIGASSAFAVVGVVGLIGSWVKYTDANDIAANCKTADRNDRFLAAERTRVAFGYTSLVGFIGAATVGTATLVYALTGKKPIPAKPSIGVIVGPAGGGLSVSGVW